MSGGSLDYLYRKTEINEITNSLNDIQRLMNELKKMQYDDIAKDVHDLYDFCLKSEIEVLERVEKLYDAIHDVEWYLSGDIGKDDLEQTCQKYRQAKIVKKHCKKYRKKPVMVEEYQTDKVMYIETLEGIHKANIGDYIITGVHGEQYPCKPNIFAETYEEDEE